MKTFRLLFVFLFLFAMISLNSQTFAQMPPLENGVSHELALWRAKHYSDVRYKLNITLEKGAPLMKGDIEIRVTLDDEGAKNDLILDWRTTQFQNEKDKPFAEVVRVNESVVKETPQNGVFDYQTNKEHLIVSKKYLKTGENVLQIKFASPIKTSGAAITRYVDKEDGAEYIYSLFVPSDASTAFPCFDQPDLKARFSLTINAPQDWKVVSNSIYEVLSPMLENDSTKSFKSQLKTIHQFKETKPISTYVFAFAAGDFVEMSEPSAVADGSSQQIVNANKNSIAPKAKLQPPATAGGSDLLPKIYVRKSQAEKFKPHAAEVFRLNREGVKYLESYFDYKFPFPKYDLVLIPEFPFGGMEHAGATFLRESSVIFPSEPTKNDIISRANVIFHEAAHQWFGDTVTMKWFDDLWLKEGFAEFMAYKTLEHSMPETNAWKAFYERNKQAAYLTDSTKGTTPIYQEISNLSAAKSAYGNIVYRKAPSFLRQAEFYLGEDKFQTAVRAFLKKHEFKNAEWTDLVKEFEMASKQDLEDWANNWVKESGVTTVRIGKKYPNEKQLYGFFSQKDISGEYLCRRMKFNLFVRFENEKTDNNKVWIACGDNLPPGSLEDINGIFLDPKKKFGNPALIFPNYQDYGYGIFLLDEKSRDYIVQNVQNEKDDFLRSMMYGSLWDSVREAELNPRDYVELVIKNVGDEKDEMIVASLLNRANTALTYYIESEPLAVASGSTRQTQNSKDNSDAKQQPFATANGSDLVARLEQVLIAKMQTAETLGQRITFYRAFLSVANSENARSVLRDILIGKFQIQNFTLKTKDKFDIVTRLASLGDKDAPQLLADLQKTETSDDAKRYAYAVGAAFPTKEAKEKYFRDFLENKEISESWIESAFVPFNSPKHSDLTIQYLEKALAELPNLKRNRKIFFINGWLSAFIGGQKDEKALAVVNNFLADNPNLDKDLRLKILENVDVIERSVKIREKFGK